MHTSLLFDVVKHGENLAALNIPVLIGAIAIVHWGQWNFVPTESHPMGGFEFQAVLLLVSLYLVIAGNRGIANNLPVIASQGEL